MEWGCGSPFVWDCALAFSSTPRFTELPYRAVWRQRASTQDSVTWIETYPETESSLASYSQTQGGNARRGGSTSGLRSVASTFPVLELSWAGSSLLSLRYSIPHAHSRDQKCVKSGNNPRTRGQKRIQLFSLFLFTTRHGDTEKLEKHEVLQALFKRKKSPKTSYFLVKLSKVQGVQATQS